MKQRLFVLDAWALLALLQKEEPAASRVKQLLEEAQDEHLKLLMSVVNLSEVYYRIGKVKGESEAQKTLEEIRSLKLTLVPATEERVFAAAGFKIRHTIPYLDAFAVATADELGAVLVTGDPELEQLQDEIKLERLSRGKR
jgi:predicted nucleic acid-binding protein